MEVRMERPTNREKYYFYNNMVCLVKALEKQFTIIDLRNESSVYGKIIHVDGYMNVEIENAIFSDSRGNKYPFEMFFVQARNIRYVHIPKHLNAVDLVKEQFNNMSKPAATTKKKPTFKIQRAKKYHNAILEELASKDNP